MSNIGGFDAFGSPEERCTCTDTRLSEIALPFEPYAAI
jgi:hypothetical protein